MLKYVCFKEEMSAEYFYHGGVLLVSASLSNQRILEIIKMYLDLKQDNCLNSKK
jgi:hypothetical protein